MNAAEKTAMRERAKGMDKEDKEIMLKAVSDEMLLNELGTRLTFANSKLKQIRDILHVQEE